MNNNTCIICKGTGVIHGLINGDYATEPCASCKGTGVSIPFPPSPDHIADTGKMVDKTPDSDQNLLSEIIAKINEWAEITAELKRQNAELRQSCILYYTEREELKKRLDEANTRIETLVKLVTN